jgi:hypothetical protein
MEIATNDWEMKMIISLVIEGRRGDIKRYRMDTSKVTPNETVRAYDDEKLRRLLLEAVAQMYPIPYTAHSRNHCLVLLAEAEQRGYATSAMEYHYHPKDNGAVP